MDVFPRARTGKVTYMNDRGRMIASLVGGITCSAMEGGGQVMMKILDGDVVREDRRRRTRRLAGAGDP